MKNIENRDENYHQITNEFIQELIECQKVITSHPKIKEKSNGQHKESDFELESIDGKYLFSIFIRKHIELIEHFSVGLLFLRRDGNDLVILRYNGNHGTHKNILTGESFDEGCHIHKLTQEALKAGISPDNQACLTDKYISVDEALLSMLQDINVQNFTDFFPKLIQPKLI